jgi:hypothetical protein
MPAHSPLSRLLLAALALAATATAQELSPRPNWEPAWHVVRPGDTLEGLARRFLGTADAWRELHRLNPGIADPNLLRPGQRVRIWVERPTLQPNAQVESVAGRVEERPAPVPWRPAAEGDLLLERDGVRTFEAGSSRLRFDDGSAVTLTENSLVFLRRHASAAAPASRKEIEIRVGQADVEAAPRAGATPEIDIVLGDAARGRATAAPGGALHARSRAEDRGSARLMIYRGQAEISAAGRKVVLPEGTGTTVEPKRPPAPAETLLPAPDLLLPAAGGELGLDDPILVWAEVPGARAYTVEVCGDAACGALIERAAGLASTRHRLARPPAGAAWWRVTAASASGLDGFPADARRLVPVDSVAPPAPTLVLRGIGGAPVSPGACSPVVPEVEVSAEDRYGRPLDWSLVVGGRDAGRHAPFSTSTRYEVAAVAHDARGRAASSPPIGFALDLVHPWADLAPALDRREIRRFWGTPSAAPQEVCGLGLEYSAGGDAWAAVPCALDGAPEAARLSLAGERADLVLRVARSARLGRYLPLEPGQATTLSLGDIGCGLAEARLRLARDEAGAPALEVEVTDHAGRASREHWRLVAR